MVVEHYIWMQTTIHNKISVHVFYLILKCKEQQNKLKLRAAIHWWISYTLHFWHYKYILPEDFVKQSEQYSSSESENAACEMNTAPV